ncbi:MAG: hypothetical protein QG639_379 [Patescibacteria group bacterium]|nr:hypothetical protein [Patescibacteria group bacterium]
MQVTNTANTTPVSVNQLPVIPSALNLEKTDEPATENSLPRIIHVISVLFFTLAAFRLITIIPNIFFPFILEGNSTDLGFRDFAVSMEFLPLLGIATLLNTIFFVGYSYLGLKIRVNSPESWKKCLSIFILLILLDLIVMFSLNFLQAQLYD